MQLKVKSADNPQNSGELWVARRGQSLVETLPAQARLACELRHAFGASNVSQRGSEKRGVAFFERSFEIGCHVFIRLEMLSGIPDASSCLGHVFLRVFACGFFGLFDVARLSGLVATDEQQHVVADVLKEVNPVARTVINLQLGNSLANGLGSSEVSARQTSDSDVYADMGGSILQRREPFLVPGRLPNFDHRRTVLHEMRKLRLTLL